MTEPAGAEVPALLEVGRITKAHGLRGEVIVFLSTDRTERVEVGSVLTTERGDLRIAASRAHQDRWIVSFDGVTSREAAESLRGLALSAPPIDDPDALWVHDLIGATVRSAEGVDRGVVESVLDNPASDLLVLDNGAMVPVAFVLGPPTDGVLLVDTPPGLFDLG